MLVTFDPHASISPHDPPGIFWAFTRYEERDLAKGAGLKWDPSTKRWWTRSPEVAKRLERFFDQSAVARLAEASGASQASILASRAETADIDVPAPQGLSLLPYQRAGVAYALQATSPPVEKGGATPSRGCLIADEMG